MQQKLRVRGDGKRAAETNSTAIMSADSSPPLHLKESLKVKERLAPGDLTEVRCWGQNWPLRPSVARATHPPLTVQHVDVHLISWNQIGQE